MAPQHPVPMILTNLTSNDLEVVGVRGKHFQDWQPGMIVQANGGTVQIATFEDYDYDTSDRSGWLYLVDQATQSQYQLYIRDKGESVGPDKTYAFFGYYAPDSSEGNPSPFPDGCATAEWEEYQVSYTLLKTPPPQEQADDMASDAQSGAE